MLKELFDSNKNIVINTDIDGFLCGMILQKYYGCKVVGFSNSSDMVWVDSQITDIDAPIYIDMYVARPNVRCIDQHVIAFNKEHYDIIKSYGTKYNPNMDRKCTFVSDMYNGYFHKYPFGTVHYIIALMAQEGIDVILPDLKQEISVTDTIDNTIIHTTSPGHILMRADDALNTSLSAYWDNAEDWWEWLDPYHKYPSVETMRQFIRSCYKNQSELYKQKIGQFFKSLGCSGTDGAFSQITDDKGILFPKIQNYINVIGKFMGMNLTVPRELVIHKGTPKYKLIKFDSDISSVMEPELYSYAIKGSPLTNKMNFSYTVNMK